MSNNDTNSIDRDALMLIAGTSIAHIADAIETHQFTDEALRSGPNGAAFGTHLALAEDLHRAPRTLAKGDDLSSPEVLASLQNAAEGVSLIFNFATARARKRNLH